MYGNWWLFMVITHTGRNESAGERQIKKVAFTAVLAGFYVSIYPFGCLLKMHFNNSMTEDWQSLYIYIQYKLYGEKNHQRTTDWRFPHPVLGFQVWSICLEYRNSNIDSALLCVGHISNDQFSEPLHPVALSSKTAKDMYPKRCVPRNTHIFIYDWWLLYMIIRNYLYNYWQA
jgi:hypothetical protein